MESKKRQAKDYSVDDDLTIEEAVFLIEWGYDLDKIKENSKKKIEG